MESVVFIILTSAHKDLYESIATLKGNQQKYQIDITTYDMSYLCDYPIDDINLNKIETIITFHKNLNKETTIYLVGDNKQRASVFVRFSGKYESPAPLFVEMGITTSLI